MSDTPVFLSLEERSGLRIAIRGALNDRTFPHNEIDLLHSAYSKLATADGMRPALDRDADIRPFESIGGVAERIVAETAKRMGRIASEIAEERDQTERAVQTIDARGAFLRSARAA